MACRWIHVFKPKTHDENPERTLKLTAETLFLTLADPANELSPENERLVRFLALMLERKKLLRARGRTSDGAKDIFEHGRSKQSFQVPAGEMTPEFFSAVQEQLGMLVGEPKAKPALRRRRIQTGRTLDGELGSARLRTLISAQAFRERLENPSPAAP